MVFFLNKTSTGHFALILELVNIPKLNNIKVYDIILLFYGTKMQGLKCTLTINVNKEDSNNFKGQLELIKKTKHPKLLIFYIFFLKYDPQEAIGFLKIQIFSYQINLHSFSFLYK